MCIFAITRHRLTEHDVNLLIAYADTKASYGPALWLVLVAFILQLIASVTVCFTYHRSRQDSARTYGKGGWFARRRAADAELEMGERRQF